MFCPEYPVIHRGDNGAANDTADDAVKNHLAKTEQAGLDQGRIAVRHIPLDLTGKKDETRQESPDKAKESKYLHDAQYINLFYRVFCNFYHCSYTPGE